MGASAVRRQRASSLAWLVVLVTTAGTASLLRAQGPAPSPLVPQIEIIPASCTGCNSGLLGATLAPKPLDLSLLDPSPRTAYPPSPLPPPLTPPDLLNPSGDCGCRAGLCYPGNPPCYPCESDTVMGRFCCALYQCICCPDPCYEGRYLPLAASSFLVESVRPVIQSRIRWNSGQYAVFPDRSEYFWARADGMGKGPPPPNGTIGERSLRYNDLLLITEAGLARFSLITTTPFRNLESENFGHASGYADMTITTKTMMFDCELIQFGITFTTHMPTGNARKGLGVGHVSLEPGGLVAIKLTPSTYFQGRISEWIPIGGDPSYQGSVLRYAFSLNQELIRFLPDAPLIASCEFQGESFQDGLYTDPILGAGQKSSGYTYALVGFGLRFFSCEKIDYGIFGGLSLSEYNLNQKLFTMEFRYRY